MFVLGRTVGGQFWAVLGAVLRHFGLIGKGSGGKDGIVLLLCGSSGVERAHSLSDGDSWSCGSRGAVDELWGGDATKGVVLLGIEG